MSTFEQALEIVAELPLEQQERLIALVRRPTMDIRSQELARSPQEALTEFRAGHLQAQTANKAIDELRNYLNISEST
ncbi:MAG: hypothetical protein HC936_02780 [Leptolyngbyaceae cyanobacterium SU_3_3]|nr:hypothetical protein [Leptolyngbyaceae cyanobacterium SU_3_3]